MRKNRPDNNYTGRNHSKFLLAYHIVFVCKYRQKLLVEYGEEIKQILFDISKKYDFTINAMETDKDHVHLLVKSVPKVSPLSIVRILKQQSTVEIWKRHKRQLRTCFWSENTFWSDGYFVATVGEASIETVKHYIENQGRKEPKC